MHGRCELITAAISSILHQVCPTCHSRSYLAHCYNQISVLGCCATILRVEINQSQWLSFDFGDSPFSHFYKKIPTFLKVIIVKFRPQVD